ncbi:hypothetical protein EX30DRAFT_39782 [Ascodesmis nigricans]|uniref:Uncharacterized protein n=1 Tax=Ascodesmis nigricans TaxID=341454 RepID=A0A4S2MW13_9PEZI|nr:hypothetical protein EX30DRAFT_39782 [Ascodesmis nigricans]
MSGAQFPHGESRPTHNITRLLQHQNRSNHQNPHSNTNPVFKNGGNTFSHLSQHVTGMVRRGHHIRRLTIKDIIRYCWIRPDYDLYLSVTSLFHNFPMFSNPCRMYVSVRRGLIHHPSCTWHPASVQICRHHLHRHHSTPPETGLGLTVRCSVHFATSIMSTSTSEPWNSPPLSPLSPLSTLPPTLSMSPTSSPDSNSLGLDVRVRCTCISSLHAVMSHY